jgi:hypothetical protein
MDEEKNKIAQSFVDYVKKFDVLANHCLIIFLIFVFLFLKSIREQMLNR